MEICKQGGSGRRGRLASMPTSQLMANAHGCAETVLRLLEYLDAPSCSTHHANKTVHPQIQSISCSESPVCPTRKSLARGRKPIQINATLFLLEPMIMR